MRRAERCIGLAIRKGQEEGRIAKQGQVKHYRANGLDVLNADIQTIVAASGMTRIQISQEAYPLADGVSHEQFESALSVAKSEKNLSRANVVRKVKGKLRERERGDHAHLRGRIETPHNASGVHVLLPLATVQ
ncbi:MAG: hypothetical protein WEF50_11210 [Myxococcota bacterium]